MLDVSHELGVTPFPLTLDVSIDACRREDLPALEWFGLYSPHRELLEEALRSQERGENLLLVARINDFPVGQVWLDLVKKAPDSTGILWALRVFPFLCRLGLGQRLIDAGERALRCRGFRIAEIGAERQNPAARRLYERLGYQLAGTALETYQYTTPEGHRIDAVADQWILQKRLDSA